MDIFSILLLVLFVLVSFLLVVMVLIQDDQGDGLAGMFGGGSSSTFGSRAGNVLTRTTSILGAIFLVVALTLAFMFKTPNTGDVSSAARKTQTTNQEWWNAPVPAAPAPATATDVPAVDPNAKSATDSTKTELEKPAAKDTKQGQ